MRREEKVKKVRKMRRIARARKKILSDKTRVRLTVFRSNKYIYAQVIDDKSGKTLFAASEKEVEGSKLNKTQAAQEIGKILAKKALAKKVKSVVFDKGSYKYHGRVKALAEGAREGGLQF